MHSSNRTACPVGQAMAGALASAFPEVSRKRGWNRSHAATPAATATTSSCACHPQTMCSSTASGRWTFAEQLREWATGVPASAHGVTIHFTSDEVAGGDLTDEVRITPACGAGDGRSETQLKSARPELVTCRLCHRTVQFRVAAEPR